MDFNQSKMILESVASHGKTGCGIITLSNQTNIDQSQLREFLKCNPDFFCQLNNKSVYAINSFGKHKGSIESMVLELSKKHSKSKYYQLVIAVMFGMVLGYLLAGI